MNNYDNKACPSPVANRPQNDRLCIRLIVNIAHYNLKRADYTAQLIRVVDPTEPAVGAVAPAYQNA